MLADVVSDVGCGGVGILLLIGVVIGLLWVLCVGLILGFILIGVVL